MPIRTYRDLEVYQQACRAALAASKLTKRFPALEQVELARQLRRAARSVPANIVEGWAQRASAAEFKRYLQVAIGSCHETQLWLEMSKDERYITEAEFEECRNWHNRIGAMLQQLWKQWRSRE